jgi:hypothetical protein
MPSPQYFVGQNGADPSRTVRNRDIAAKVAPEFPAQFPHRPEKPSGNYIALNSRQLAMFDPEGHRENT